MQEPVRQKLPRTRTSKTFSFRVADCHGYVTVGEYEDGRPGEMWLNVAKQGSTLAGIMDAFAISVSHGLQYGVPLEAYVEMYTNMRFEPAGMTDDPDIRFATSLVDYIFRRLAVEYLSKEKREAMGILTVGERLQPTLPGVDESTMPSGVVDRPAARRPCAVGVDPVRSEPVVAPPVAPVARPRDVVLCHVCGDMMQRGGKLLRLPQLRQHQRLLVVSRRTCVDERAIARLHPRWLRGDRKETTRSTGFAPGRRSATRPRRRGAVPCRNPCRE